MVGRNLQSCLTHCSFPRPNSGWIGRAPPAQSSLEDRLRSVLYLRHASPPPSAPSCLWGAVPKRSPQKTPSTQVSFSVSVSRELDLRHSLAPELWTKYISSPLLSFLMCRTEMTIVPSTWGVVRMNKLIHANFLEHCLAQSKRSINVYYELLLWACFLL